MWTSANTAVFDRLSAHVRRLYVCHFCCPLTFFAPQSVYGLQNDVRTHSPTHIPAPEAKQPTEEELQEQVSNDLKMASECL